MGLKKFIKAEGITGKKPDIILMSDCRVGCNKGELEKMFNMTMNGQYDLYLNSENESRGTGIAVKRGISIIIECTFGIQNTENALFMELKRDTLEIICGVIYGPNENNIEFFNEIRNTLERTGKKFIIGGDFNTILDHRLGNENVDREGEGAIHNKRNGEIINQGIIDGFWVDPFRILYSDRKESSFISFRVDNRIVKNRLDFYLISPDLTNIVNNVQYEFISSDFDHKEVVLTMGEKSVKKKETIFNSTLKSNYAEILGKMGAYEIINNHLRVPKLEIAQNMGTLERCWRENELLYTIMRAVGVINEVERNRMELNTRTINEVLNGWPAVENLLEEELTLILTAW
jgi:exonuclease III